MAFYALETVACALPSVVYAFSFPIFFSPLFKGGGLFGHCFKIYSLFLETRNIYLLCMKR